MELTLAPCATPSISTKWTFGNSLATFCTAWVWAKPIDAIRSRFLRANARRTCSAWVSLEACTSIKPMPVSFLKRVAPSKADWLNDLSNLPPASYTMPSFGSAADALAATNSAAIVKLNCLSFMNRLLEDRYCIFLLGQTCNLTARDGLPALISAGAARNAVRLIAAEKNRPTLRPYQKLSQCIKEVWFAGTVCDAVYRFRNSLYLPLFLFFCCFFVRLDKNRAVARQGGARRLMSYFQRGAGCGPVPPACRRPARITLQAAPALKRNRRTE